MDSTSLAENLKVGLVIVALIVGVLFVLVAGLSIYLGFVFLLFWIWAKFWIVLLIFIVGSVILAALDIKRGSDTKD